MSVHGKTVAVAKNSNADRISARVATTERLLATKTSWLRYYRLKRTPLCLNVNRHGLLCHCRHQSVLVVSRHVHISRGTSLSGPHDGTQRLASALCCDAHVACLRVQAILHGESEAVVHEPIVTCRADRVSPRAVARSKVTGCS